MSNQSIMTLIVSIFVSLILVACAGPDKLGSRHGDSTGHNTLHQTVDTTAGHANVADSGLDGQKAEQIIKAYRKDDGSAMNSSLVNKVGN